ncbi:hypothetical protein AB685_12805 [Bacillus sp. LL01]|uniref:DUF6154 family protein n=1 Tax=Bacillus sp. LL01 TaxID=1665556 RepID=UPI00064D1335|nr:DUF6154 family protein [Bacillus sp. LL01]KMJ57732.1 hypothetical protein AB685_12805 [Bacillus sp. LL01]
MRTFDTFVNKYHKKLIRDDEDIDAVAYSIVNGFTREQCIDLLNELSDEELHQVVSELVMEQVKEFLISGDDEDRGLLH